MQEQQPQGWTPIQDAKNAANILAFASRVLASPVEVMLRKRFGSRYFGLPTACALFAVPMWMLFWPAESPDAILVFWGLFILSQAMARAESARMVAKGDIVHTRYNGWPRLASVFKRTPESKIKSTLEPGMVLVAALCLMPVSPPLGSYLIVAALALAMNHSLIESVERAQALEMHDALIEQQDLAARFREIQNGRMRP